jgi:hypothetical protein
MKRLLVLLLVIAAILSSSLFFYNKHIDFFHTTNISIPSCKYNNRVSTDLFLNKYEVKQEDTLLSIAQNQLGDSSRIDEIINTNKTKYPEVTNNIVKVGWILSLPPAFYPKTSGYLEVNAGPVLKVNNDWISINVVPGKSVPEINYFTENTLFLMKTPLQEGDCVLIVNDALNRAGTGIVAITKQDSNYLKDSSAPKTSNTTNKNTDCVYATYLDNKFFLNEYTVVKGDSLSKVAEKQLSSATRINELIALNKTKYPNISTSNSFLEVGWVLYIPPRFFPPSTGYLIGHAGKIVSTDVNDNVVIDLNNHNSELSNSPDEVLSDELYIHKRKDTVFLGMHDYTVGKCVYIIEDTSDGTPKTIGAIAVTPQDKNYFK